MLEAYRSTIEKKRGAKSISIFSSTSIVRRASKEKMSGIQFLVMRLQLSLTNCFFTENLDPASGIPRKSMEEVEFHVQFLDS